MNVSPLTWDELIDEYFRASDCCFEVAKTPLICALKSILVSITFRNGSLTTLKLCAFRN